MKVGDISLRRGARGSRGSLNKKERVDKYWGDWKLSVLSAEGV
jgi:hypothetical protein